MKCHLCINYEDPANCDCVIMSGTQRKEEHWGMEENGQVLTMEPEKQKLEMDAMSHLEHQVANN